MKAVIFDIGKVLARFEWEAFTNRLFDGDKTRIDAVNTAVWGDLLWVELDRGVMEEAEVLSAIRRKAEGFEEDIDLLIEHIGEVVEKCDYAIPWIREVKAAGHPVYFLSNYSDFLRRSNPKALDFIPETDGGVWSDEAKCIKPDPAIYQALCDTYHLDPADCIFIDDNPDNVKGAVDFGMDAILFTDYETARKQLDHKLLK